MNEYETDPQRPTARPEQEQPTAEVNRDAVQPQRDQADPSVRETGAGFAETGAAPGSDQPGSDGAPVDAASRSGPEYPQAGTYQSGSGYQPAGYQPGSGYPAAPAYQHQPEGWQPQQPAWPGNGGYGVPPQSGEAGSYGVPPQSGAGAYGVPPQSGAGAYGAPPQSGAGAYGAPYPGDGTHQQSMPPWAQPVAPQQPPRRSGAGKVLALMAGALALTLTAGGVGAWTALALDDDADTVPVGENRPAVAAPVVDRSSLAQIAAKVEDSVVSIKTGSGEGSGVVLTADGFVLSNNHVVANAQGGTVNVIFANGKSAQAKIVGTDPRTDLAVVKAEGVSGLTPADLGDSSAMQVGDTVLALGSPLGLQGSVTAGIISAKDRTIQAGGQQDSPLGSGSGATSMSGLLQTDAPINPGNSGGALVNTNGEVIGINTAIATGGQGNGNIGVGFAIPSNKAKQVSEQLRNGEKVSHPALGVSVSAAEGGGAVVRSVTPNGAAAKAGLKVNDVVTEVDGKPVNDSDDLVAIVQSGKVGDQLKVTYNRNGTEQNTTATLAEAS